MEFVGKSLMVAGAVLLAVGVVIYLHPSIPILGKLPGDIRIERSGFRVYLPITTCLLLSAGLSAILYLISKLR